MALTLGRLNFVNFAPITYWFYALILNDKLISTLKRYKVKDIIFQQDNDTKHASELAQAWFKRHQVNVVGWPSQCPDLIQFDFYQIPTLLSIFSMEACDLPTIF
jgi:hypothetical protein